MGYHYRDGISVPKDMQRALSSYRKAAEQGDLRSQRMLCGLYQDSDEPKTEAYVEPFLRSNVEAYAWCSFAASNPAKGFGANAARSEALGERERIAHSLSAVQLAASLELIKKEQAKFKALRTP
jgi:TPR repeat protein